MANTLKFGNGVWANKKGSTLAYNDESGNFKPLPFTTTRSTSATRVNKEGLIEVVSNEVPRVDYTDSEDGVFLLEKAATNILPYSENFNVSNWIKLGTAFTVTSNNVISPSGELNASTINVTNNDNILYESITLSSSSADWVFSIYAKGSGTFDMNVRLNSSTTSTETKTLTNDWQRFNVSATRTPTITSVECFIELNTSSTYQIWGGQLESENLSSYIPTQGAAVTRSADTASGSGNSEVFNDSEGVLFANISALDNDGTERYIYLGDGTTANRIVIRFSPTINDLRMLVTSGGSTQVSSGTTNYNITNFNKIALKYKQNNFALWVNGVEALVDTNGSTPIGMDELSFSYSGTEFKGNVKDVRVYNTALTDQELQELTTI